VYNLHSSQSNSSVKYFKSHLTDGKLGAGLTTLISNIGNPFESIIPFFTVIIFVENHFDFEK